MAVCWFTYTLRLLGSWGLGRRSLDGLGSRPDEAERRAAVRLQVAAHPHFRDADLLKATNVWYVAGQPAGEAGDLSYVSNPCRTEPKMRLHCDPAGFKTDTNRH